MTRLLWDLLGPVKRPGEPCYRDFDCAAYSCMLCRGTGIVQPPQPLPSTEEDETR